MRVLFASWAGGGHFAPLVPTGWALRAAGHEVLVACHPSGRDAVVRAGLAALPLGPDLDMFALLRARRASGERGYAGMVGTALAVAEHLIDDLVAYGRTWRPDLVVYEPASLVGPLAAAIFAVPAVRQLWTCDFTAPVAGFPETVAGELTERFGVAPLRTAGDLTLDPCPPAMQVTDELARQPVRYIPYNGPATVPPWLLTPPARPRVCITWGTSLYALDPRRLRHLTRVVNAVASLDVEVVVAVLDQHRSAVGPQPSNVISVGPVALHLLLPTCDAIVHQGGGGTLMTAMACGVPQVVVPTIADQTFNARHLAATGAGVHVPGAEEVTEEDVVTSTLAVLTRPEFRDAAANLRAQHENHPTPAQVVPVLEELAAARTLVAS